MELRKKDLFICRNKLFANFIGVGIEGDALMLNQGLEQYLKNGELKKKVEFSPILLSGEGLDLCRFLVGNIYSPWICTLSADQYALFHRPNTSILCIGTSEKAVDLVYDFAKNIELEPYAHSKDFIVEVLYHQKVYQGVYNKYRAYGKSLQKIVVSEALKENQRLYRKEASHSL